MTNDLGKMVVVLNHDDANSVLASLVMAASIATGGEQVFFFVQPGGARMLATGELEKYRGLKGQPDPIHLYESIRTLEGRFILCELGLAVAELEKENLRDGVEVMMASSFMFEIEGAKLSFCY